jgi:hypothetical protein
MGWKNINHSFLLVLNSPEKKMPRLIFCFLLLAGFALASQQQQQRTYVVDIHHVCEVKREPGTAITRIALDNHIRGPLIQELEEHLRKYNSGLEFKIIAEYLGSTNNYGHGTEQNSGWVAILYIRGEGELVCPEFLGRWNVTEMRARWHCSPRNRYDDASVYWPFDPIPEDGDQPPLYRRPRILDKNVHEEEEEKEEEKKNALPLKKHTRSLHAQDEN